MNVLFNENVKEPLIIGVNLIGDAVASTFGPQGTNVIIATRSGLHITKDGATVAHNVSHSNPAINMGINVLKDIAKKTAKDVGDGTTTSTILAQSIINQLKDSKKHPIQISRDLYDDLQKVILYLDTKKKEINSYEDLLKVATLSANNDPILGKLIAETYYKVGKDGVVTMQESNDILDSVVYSTGLEIEAGYLSPYFVNTNKNTCELTNVQVAIFKEPIKEIKDILDIADKAKQAGKSLLIMAPKVDSTVVITLRNNLNLLQSCIVLNPGHGIYRDILTDDLKLYLGKSLTCEKVIIGKEATTFIGCNITDEEKENKIIEIKDKLENSNFGEFDLEFYKKRLANFLGGIATIFVGGYSKVEIVEKKDRVEDAIAATKAAYVGGVLPGGGSALYMAAEELDLKYLKPILKTPFNILAKNANYNEYWFPLFWTGVDFKNYKAGDMYELGIIDPFLVTKIALENAVTAASLILTTSCAIINID